MVMRNLPAVRPLRRPSRSRTMTISFLATRFDSAAAAIEHRRHAGGQAILLGGKALVIAEPDADRLAAAGVEFAYLGLHARPDGRHRVVTVPVN